MLIFEEKELNPHTTPNLVSNPMVGGEYGV